MEKSYFVKLTQAVYRTTDLFPEGESLKGKIRDKANEILTDLVLNDPQAKEQTIRAIDVLKSYFEVARIQNWTNPLNFIILEQEYDKITEELGMKNNPARNASHSDVGGELDKEAKQEKKEEKSEKQILNVQHVNMPMIAVSEVGFQVAPVAVKQEKEIKYSERHQKILDFLKTKGQAQVWEVKEILENISKRTIRRDFEYLVEKNLVQRIGEKNNTFYRTK